MNPKTTHPTRKKECKVIGITGAMGSGKSTLMSIISRRGYSVLSADQLAREAVEPGGQGFQQVVSTFGPSIVQGSGHLDRKKLRELITASPEARVKLESILHPLIHGLFLERRDLATDQGVDLLFYEAPLLFEAGADKRVDFRICVSSPEEMRIKRVVARDSRSEIEVRKLMATQMPEEEKIRRSDFEIKNAGSVSDLENQFDSALALLKNRLGMKTS